MVARSSKARPSSPHCPPRTPLRTRPLATSTLEVPPLTAFSLRVGERAQVPRRASQAASAPASMPTAARARLRAPAASAAAARVSWSATWRERGSDPMGQWRWKAKCPMLQVKRPS